MKIALWLVMGLALGATKWKMYRHPNDEDKCVVELRVDTVAPVLDNTNILNS